MQSSDGAEKIQIAIKRIALVSYNLSEELDRQDSPSLSVTVSQKTKFNISEETAVFNITFSYTYENTDITPISITVLNEFSLKGILGIQESDESGNVILGKIPRPTIVTCLSLSLTQTRTLLSQFIGGSIFADRLPLVIFDPTTVADTLYPHKQQYELDKVIVPPNPD